MKDKNCVILDLTDCRYLGELHQRIKVAFDFPDYYGENWDAFYDLICTDSKAEMIIILGKNEMSKSLFFKMPFVFFVALRTSLDDILADLSWVISS